MEPTYDMATEESRVGARSDAGSSALEKVEILKALVQDYTSARTEVVLHIQLYKTQERYGTVIVGALGLLIPLLISGNITEHGWKDLKALGPEAILFGLFTISTVLFHMYFSTLANLFALQVLAERCVILQDQINDCVNGRYFFWERLTKLIWSKDGLPIHKMPDHMTGIFSFLLASVFGFFLPLYVLWNVLPTSHSVIFNCFAALYVCCLFTAAILAVVTFVSITRVRDECHRMFDVAIKSGKIFSDAMYTAPAASAWSNTKAISMILLAAAAATALLFCAIKYLG